MWFLKLSSYYILLHLHCNGRVTSHLQCRPVPSFMSTVLAVPLVLTSHWFPHSCDEGQLIMSWLFCTLYAKVGKVEVDQPPTSISLFKETDFHLDTPTW